MTIQPKRDAYDDIADETERRLRSVKNIGGRQRAKLEALALSEGAISFLFEEFGADYVTEKLYRTADKLAPECKAVFRKGGANQQLQLVVASAPRRRQRRRMCWGKVFGFVVYLAFLFGSIWLFCHAVFGGNG